MGGVIVGQLVGIVSRWVSKLIDWLVGGVIVAQLVGKSVGGLVS